MLMINYFCLVKFNVVYNLGKKTEHIFTPDDKVISHCGGESRTPVTYVMEFFITLINDFQPSTNVTKSISS